jgi:hypothetical protein
VALGAPGRLNDAVSAIGQAARSAMADARLDAVARRA